MFRYPMEEVFLEFLAYSTLEPGRGWGGRREACKLAERCTDRYERVRAEGEYPYRPEESRKPRPLAEQMALLEGE